VWFETHDSIAAAYQREQLIKRWRRDWKIALIEKAEPALERSVRAALTTSASRPEAPRKRGGEPGPRLSAFRFEVAVCSKDGSRIAPRLSPGLRPGSG
jgi:hypothetical protein